MEHRMAIPGNDEDFDGSSGQPPELESSVMGLGADDNNEDELAAWAEDLLTDMFLSPASFPRSREASADHPPQMLHQHVRQTEMSEPLLQHSPRDPSSESNDSASCDVCKRSHRPHKRPKSLMPKRPMSAWQLFVCDMAAEAQRSNSIDHFTPGKMQKRWLEMPAIQRACYQQQAEEDHNRYHQEMERHSKKQRTNADEDRCSSSTTTCDSATLQHLSDKSRAAVSGYVPFQHPDDQTKSTADQEIGRTLSGSSSTHRRHAAAHTSYSAQHNEHANTVASGAVFASAMSSAREASPVPCNGTTALVYDPTLNALVLPPGSTITLPAVSSTHDAPRTFMVHYTVVRMPSLDAAQQYMQRLALPPRRMENIKPAPDPPPVTINMHTTRTESHGSGEMHFHVGTANGNVPYAAAPPVAGDAPTAAAVVGLANLTNSASTVSWPLPNHGRGRF